MSVTFKKENVLQVLVFLVNPFLCFLISLYYSFKTKKNIHIIVLSLSLALIFCYFPLMYDTSSNYYQTYFAAYNGAELQDIRLYNAIALYLNMSFGIQFMAVIFLFTTFIFLIWFTIFKHYRNLAKTKEMICYMAIFSFSSIIFRGVMDLNRFYLATSILLLLAYISEINKEKNIQSSALLLVFLGILAFSIHSATAVFFIVYFLAKKKIHMKLLSMLPFISLFIGFFSDTILSILLNTPLLENIPFFQSALSYTDTSSQWGSGYKRQIDYILLSKLIEVFLMFLIYYKGLTLLKLDRDNVFIQFSLLLMCFILFCISYFSIYERYSLAFFLFSSFIVYKSILFKKRNDLLLSLIIIGFIVRFIFINIVWYGMIFTTAYAEVLPNQNKKIEMALKPFIYPTILLLYIENTGYSDIYIQNESLRGAEYDYDYTINPITNKRGFNSEVQFQ